MTPWRPIAAAVFVALAGTACSSRQPTTPLVFDDCPLAVRLVAEEPTTATDRRRLAAGLADRCLDEIAVAAIEQREQLLTRGEAGTRPLRRPQVVSFFAALAGDGDAADATIESLVEWAEAQLLVLLDDPDVQRGDVLVVVRPVAAVLSAAADGFDQAGGERGGNDVERLVTQELRARLAASVAAERGDPTPQPGGLAAYLDTQFPATGDPVELLALAAGDETADHRDDDSPW
ncbi:MAG: hypothetical protein ACRD29_04390 [Acidimicrobiales bacterium]